MGRVYVHVRMVPERCFLHTSRYALYNLYSLKFSTACVHCGSGSVQT